MVEGTPPGDARPPPPQRATPARKGAHCGAGAGSPRPHRPHPGHTGRGTLAARSRRRAAGGGTAPDTRRPSQNRQATPPGDGPPSPPRHAAPTGHAGQGDSVGPPHRHTRAHSTWVVDPNSPPSLRAVGGRTAPDLRRPSQWWKAPPPGTPVRHPHSEQRRPARAHTVGPVLGPHARTDCTRDTRVAEPWLPAPEDGQSGEGERLTPDAPHIGGRPTPPGTGPHHPRGTQPPQGMQAKGTVLGPHTHTPAPTARGWRTQTARPVGGQWGEGQRLTSDAPHNGGRHPPFGDALPPPPQRATPARNGARCGAGAGSPRPHRPHPGHTGRGTLAARSRGRAVGGGTAPDLRPPSQWWKAPPPGTPLRHPHSEQRRPARANAVGPVLGLHARTARTRDTRVAEPQLPAPEYGRPGEGQRLTPDAPHNGGRHPPPGTPFRHPHSEQRRPTRAHAVGPVLGPHASTNRTQDTRVVEPWLPAPEDGRPGEGQRLTPGSPDNGGRPPPRGTAPHHPRGTQPPKGMQAKGTVLGPHTHTPAPTARGWRTPTARPVGGQSGEGQRLTSDAPHNGGRHPPQGRSSATPHSEQRRLARAHAVGPVLGPHARTDRTRDTRVAEPWLPTPEDGRTGERQHLTPDAPHNSGRPPPRGTAPYHPRGTQPPKGMHAKGTVLGPHTHTLAPTARGWRTPTAHPVGGKSGEGQRLTSNTPHNGGRHPPRGRPSATPTASNAGPQGRTLWGRGWVPTPAPTASGTHGSQNPGCPLQRTGSWGRESA